MFGEEILFCMEQATNSVEVNRDQFMKTLYSIKHGIYLKIDDKYLNVILGKCTKFKSKLSMERNIVRM